MKHDKNQKKPVIIIMKEISPTDWKKIEPHLRVFP